MRGLKRFFYQPRTDIQKSAYIWNMFAGMSSAMESVVFSIVITRVIGLAEAGIATLGFAVGNLMATIGKYGVRTFQVTDVECKYSFSEYFYVRIVTTTVMLVSNLGYVFFCYHYKNYSILKSLVVLVICLKFIVEVLEDVFGGECQKRGRLDVASKIFVTRSFTFLTTFIISILLARELLVSVFVAFGAIIIIEIISLHTVKSEIEFDIERPSGKQIRELLIKCFPLFLSTFSFFYITNAPKYAIDTVMNDEVQACYGFIAFPVFAIELLNNFIYQPTLVRLAKDWIDRKIGLVRKRLTKQILIVCGITCMVLIGAWFLGIPLLSFIFGTDLTAYKREMMVLLLTGGLLALIGYFSTVLITMREAKIMIIAYVVDLIVSIILYTPVIRKYGILGGVILYCSLCALFSLYEYIFIRIRLKATVSE